MAVLSKYPGLEVTVMVDKKPLQEYDDDSEETPQSSTTTKYIEAKSGAQFTVAGSLRHPFSTPHSVVACLYIDGKAMSAYTPHNQVHIFQWEHRHWQRDGEWVEQDFRFSELDVVEEAGRSQPNITALRRDIGSKGCITVKLWFAKDFRPGGVPPDRKRLVQLTALDNIPEKALKGSALSHQASLTEPRRSQNQSPLSFNSYNLVDKDPFAIFHFKYRSLASLQALRIVKINDVPPVPLEERPEEELSPEELRELVRRMRQRSVTIKPEPEAPAQIKAEKPTYDDDEVAIIESRPCKRAQTDAETIVID